MTAMAIAQGIGGFMNKKKEARQQQERYNANRAAAVVARDLKIQSLNQRAIQEQEGIVEDKMALAIKAMEVKESQVVAAGEAGVAGKSVDQQIAQTEARKLRGITTYNGNIKNLLNQVELEKTGLNAEAMNRINSLQQGTPPSAGMAVLGIASNLAAMDMKYGDGKMFGINLKGDANVSAMATKGTYGSSIKPLRSPADFSIFR